jgi:hypothetical protein
MGLLHIDILRDITMKKCITHLHMMEFPSLGFYNGKCQSYGIHLCHWSEGLIIVNSMHLVKSFGNKPGFVSTNMSFHYALGLVDPYAYEKFPPRRKGNQIPSLFLEEGLYSSYMADSQNGFPTSFP